MATNNPNVDSIVGYVDEQRVPLIGKSVLGAKAPKYFNLMTGVKGTTALNLINADPALQCGNACGFKSENDTTFTQREMEAIPFKVNMTFCDKNLLDTWANYEVKVAAGIKNLPFEEEWTGQIVTKVQDQLEKFIWAGGTYCDKTVKGIEQILAKLRWSTGFWWLCSSSTLPNWFMLSPSTRTTKLQCVALGALCCLLRPTFSYGWPVVAFAKTKHLSELPTASVDWLALAALLPLLLLLAASCAMPVPAFLQWIARRMGFIGA